MSLFRFSDKPTIRKSLSSQRECVTLIVNRTVVHLFQTMHRLAYYIHFEFLQVRSTLGQSQRSISCIRADNGSMVPAGHGSNGSPKLDGLYGSWVSGVDPMAYKYFYFYRYSYVIWATANCCLC
jgi:hypothetical protein